MGTLTALPPTNSVDVLIHTQDMSFGPTLLENGAVRFVVWAPAAKSVELALEGHAHSLPLERREAGWHELTTGDAHVGSKYRFLLPDGTLVPDPASRFQPDDVHGPSEVIDPRSYAWGDTEWKSRTWPEAVVYELHVGTFTEAGTFRAAIEKLDYLAELGVTAIELMPIADFAGRRNWGYDGVLLYAPDSSYGHPNDLKALVDAAHARGLMVFLDVVYNHFGPDGNYLVIYAPQIVTDRHKTPWGDAVNYDGEGSEVVREFVIRNAMYWIEEFHFDGLRLDAVHAIKDDSPRHLLQELADRVRAAAPHKQVHLILENEDNQVHRLRRDASGAPIEFTAQWNDDMHHVLHTAATLESKGYYREYVEDTEKLGRALAEGFAFQGEVMECRGCERGEPSAELPATAFVAFMQNHDQIGNRAFGERINAIASAEAVHAIASIYLLLPQIPMLFMGEEWGSSQPFPFFCDFAGELGNLVREGRREEFKNFPEFDDPEKRLRIPDPQAEETFLSGKLDWAQLHQEVHSDWLAWYKRILVARRGHIQPLLQNIGGFAGQYKVLQTGAVTVRWRVDDQRTLVLQANLSDNSVGGFEALPGQLIWKEGPERSGDVMRPWSVVWSLQEGPAS
jgi:maltooligosyltrehalose trehalohydrolase